MSGDALGHEGLPVREYISAEQFEKEKHTVWRNSWLIMGREADIPKPGDYTVTELAFLSLSILIVRGKDNVIRAFHNVCRHRGMNLCSEPQGSLKSIGCQFHGWVYDLAGRLVNVPFEDHFVDLPRHDLGLIPIATEVWGGFIFINLAPKPEVPLAEYLAPLPRPLHDYFARENWQWYYGFKYPLRANWKIIIDVQHEGYHVNFLHAQTIEPGFAASDVPVWAYPDARGVLSKLEVLRPETEGASPPKPTPVAAAAFANGTPFIYSEFEVKGVHEKYPGAINTRGEPRWSFDSYLLFPNAAFHIYNDQLLLHRVWPLSANSSLWLYDFFFLEDPPKTFGQLFARTYYICAGRDIISEDTTTVEAIQRNYESGVIDKIYLSDLELAARVFRRRLQRSLAEGEQKRNGKTS